MRFAWLVWLADEGRELGYGNGLLPGAIGTIAVLLTALLVGQALRRHRPAALACAGLVCAAGIGWLATH